MKIEIFEQEEMDIKVGCAIVDTEGDLFLVTHNDLDPPCACSESMGKGYVLIKLNAMTTWSIYTSLKDIKESMCIAKVIQPDNLLLKEI